MIYTETKLNCCDNSGAKIVKCLKIIPYSSKAVKLRSQILKLVIDHTVDYTTPNNINYWWGVDSSTLAYLVCTMYTSVGWPFVYKILLVTVHLYSPVLFFIFTRNLARCKFFCNTKIYTFAALVYHPNKIIIFSGVSVAHLFSGGDFSYVGFDTYPYALYNSYTFYPGGGKIMTAISVANLHLGVDFGYADPREIQRIFDSWSYENGWLSYEIPKPPTGLHNEAAAWWLHEMEYTEEFRNIMGQCSDIYAHFMYSDVEDGIPQNILKDISAFCSNITKLEAQNACHLRQITYISNYENGSEFSEYCKNMLEYRCMTNQDACSPTMIRLANAVNGAASPEEITSLVDQLNNLMLNHFLRANAFCKDLKSSLPEDCEVFRSYTKDK